MNDEIKIEMSFSLTFLFFDKRYNFFVHIINSTNSEGEILFLQIFFDVQSIITLKNGSFCCWFPGDFPENSLNLRAHSFDEKFFIKFFVEN